MTNEYYKERLQKLEKEYEEKKKLLRLEYVVANAKFSVGMDIGNKKISIRVTRVYYMSRFDSVPEILYEGTILNKDMQPNKRGNLFTFNHSEEDVYHSALPLKT